MAQHRVTSVEVSATAVTVYKVVAGGDSLMAYNAAHKDDLDGIDSLQHAEWRALYTQFKRDHVIGTVPYRWEKGHSEAALVEATFAALDVVVLSGPLLHDINLSGGDKAAVIKSVLGLNRGEPLMDALGRQGKAALVKETEEEWELIIPHALLDALSFSERVVARFRRHPAIQITHRWCDACDGIWKPWQEGITLPECIPDLDMGWLGVRSSLCTETEEEALLATEQARPPASA
uniref:Uncharacterized protein n=1 Tax=Pyrodinium bahamense TaxID=73915 RepID=A0A7S0FAE3_9DINO